jgi:hypothetical protein
MFGAYLFVVQKWLRQLRLPAVPTLLGFPLQYL